MTFALISRQNLTDSLNVRAAVDLTHLKLQEDGLETVGRVCERNTLSRRRAHKARFYAAAEAKNVGHVKEFGHPHAGEPAEHLTVLFMSNET